MGDAVKKVFETIKDNDVAFVDFRFTDPRGKWQHTAQTISTVQEEVFEEGIMFDGSSIAGWRGIQESDMTLIPDPTTATLDPFTAQPSLVLFCDVREPVSGQSYSRDPRSTAKKLRLTCNLLGSVIQRFLAQNWSSLSLMMLGGMFQ